MVLDELDSHLPRTAQELENAHRACDERKKFISVPNREFAAYLEKAKSDLERVESDYLAEGWDWVVVKSYYAIHHASNALLVRFQGKFSKDHICTILALKRLNLIPASFYDGMRAIYSKFSDFTAFDLTYLMRKVGQYDVRKWKDIDKNDADAIYSFAKEFLGFAEKRCYEK